MENKNGYLQRYLATKLKKVLEAGYSCLVLGPRQVGKTTLVKYFLKDLNNKVEYYLQNPTVRADIEKDPGIIIREVEAEKNKSVVFIDEAQKVPEVFDSAQFLIDNKTAQFILTGSSARKLRRGTVNLLPGRIKQYYLDPLLWGELGLVKENYLAALSLKNVNKDLKYAFDDLLVYGSLPGITSLPESDRADFLRAYAVNYLEEEIRAEALSRKIGAFSRFLELAARESGTSPNYSKLSNESGVSVPAIREYYQLLADTLLVERVEPYLKNSRKRILSSHRYYFFDLGVRNALSRLPLEKEIINLDKGILFEHAVMLEIIRRIRTLGKNYQVCYWRTAGGAEVDCIIDLGREVIPIEIKSNRRVTLGELKGLRNFLVNYSAIAKQGYVITMGDKKERLAENILALPWSCL